MSRFVLSFTLVLSFALIAVALTRGTAHASNRAEAKPAGAGRPSKVFGFPDPRGIVLLMKHEPSSAACEGTRFRLKSPDFVLWDTGEVVYRTSSYDYRRGRMGREQARSLARVFESEASKDLDLGCGAFRRPSSKYGATVLEGRVAGEMEEIRIVGLEHFGGDHAETCVECRPFVPLARLARELDRYDRPCDSLMSGLATEVQLQRRHCGCRDYPDIAAASFGWPLAGPTPFEICKNLGGTIVLRDRGEVERLARAIERTAAVVEGDQLYTCFMRPLFELP